MLKYMYSLLPTFIQLCMTLTLPLCPLPPLQVSTYIPLGPSLPSLQTSASARVVNQLLTEMDGLQARKQVFIMAATNRPGKGEERRRGIGIRIFSYVCLHRHHRPSCAETRQAGQTDLCWPPPSKGPSSYPHYHHQGNGVHMYGHIHNKTAGI